MAKSAPTGHIATTRGEIEAHGPHADLVVPASFGSHQIRVNPDGEIFSNQLNFFPRLTPEVGSRPLAVELGPNARDLWPGHRP